MRHIPQKSKTEYQGVNLATGEQIFYRDLGNQTVNIGEFLAVVEAVKFIIENDFQPRIIIQTHRPLLLGSRPNQRLPINETMN